MGGLGGHKGGVFLSIVYIGGNVKIQNDNLSLGCDAS